MALKVFYSPRQTAPQNLSRSPSAQKPALVVRAWEATGIPLAIIEPRPATLADFYLAHDPVYVRAVLAGQIPNGFGNKDPAVNATLPWTSGSIISAAEWAITHGEPALSPTSGFHHAGWDYGAAYCTFNGLMVAALALHSRQLVRRVAILDLDQHFGDGTRDIIGRLGISWIRHYTYGLAPATRENAGPWLNALPQLVRETVQSCDLVLYQAGVDPHIDDPLGGGLTAEQLARRDHIVFQGCRETGAPFVVNLAGGYQKPVDRVVELHVSMLRALSAVYSPRETQGA